MARVVVPAEESLCDAGRCDPVDVWWAVLAREDMGWERLVYAARALRDARAVSDANHLPSNGAAAVT